MRVLVNAASAHMGGAVTYVWNLLRWLPRVSPESTFVVYLPEETRNGLEERDGVELRSYPYESTGGAQRLRFDQWDVPWAAVAEDVDVLFSSTGFGTFVSPVPQVLLVRNRKYFDPVFQEAYRAIGRGLWENRMRRYHSLLSIATADSCLFPSAAMERLVDDYISLDTRRTRVIHHGFDRDLFRTPSDGFSFSSPRTRADFRAWKCEGAPRLLNVSTYAIHKNLETVVDALPALLDRFPDLKLATTTSREQTSEVDEYDALRRRAAELGVAEAWIELGYVPYEDLHSLYSLADLYVFPSFTESFGHSMVEAMASGLPIAAADTDVNREVSGPAARFFPPFDPSACSAAVTEVLENDDLYEDLVSGGDARVRSFSWSRYADELVREFAQISEESDQ